MKIAKKNSIQSLDIKNRLSLIFYFAILNIKIRFKNTQLGFLWAAIEPFLYFIVLYIVFTNIQKTSENFSIYLITGVMIYHIFLRGTSGGLGSLVANIGILESVNIRRIFFPIVSTAAIGLLAFVDLAVFFAFMVIFGFTPPWTIVFLPLVLLLVIILIQGLSFLLSIINVYAKDIQNIWTIFLHTLLFISPVFWYLENVGGALIEIHKINPVGQLIEISHKLVIDGQIPSINDWAYTTSIVFGIFFLGYFVFHKLENKIVEDI